MQTAYKVRLYIISPVHIGCDDVYEPMNFIIDEQKKKLVEFDPFDLIKSLSSEDKQRFSSICMQGDLRSMIQIYKFLTGKQIKGREVDIVQDLIENYKRVRELSLNDERKIKQELNQFLIKRTTYNPHNNLPYIPGSSLKGSLRTGYLTMLAGDRNITKVWDNYWKVNEKTDPKTVYYNIGKKNIAKNFEKELLQGNFATDPLRMVKVSDLLPIDNVKIKIIYVINKKKKQSKFIARGIPQIIETIENGSIFEGMINIQKPERGSQIKNPIKIEDFLKSVNKFYNQIVNEEEKVLTEIDADNSVIRRINERFKDALGNNIFLVRMGRHSGAEAVTIAGNRYIKIKQGKGQPDKYLDHATTIWLASETNKPKTNNNLIPMGWAALEVL